MAILILTGEEAHAPSAAHYGALIVLTQKDQSGGSVLIISRQLPEHSCLMGIVHGMTN